MYSETWSGSAEWDTRRGSQASMSPWFWHKARLNRAVRFSSTIPIPDRLPEVANSAGPSYGFDHNQEYRIWGYYSGRKIYDPNSDLILPEFVLQRYELRNPSPGWLFSPKERFNGAQLLRNEPEALPNR